MAAMVKGKLSLDGAATAAASWAADTAAWAGGRPACAPLPDFLEPLETSVVDSMHATLSNLGVAWRVRAEVSEALSRLSRHPGVVASAHAAYTAASTAAAATAAATAPGVASSDRGGAVLPSAHEYLFGMDRGLLTATDPTLDALRVGLVGWEVNGDAPCLGDRLPRGLLAGMVGYDTAIVSSLASASGGRGFVTLLAAAPVAGGGGNPISLSHGTPLSGGARPSWFSPTTIAVKLGTLCSATFLLFASSSLVSFTLAQTQQRMLRFTAALQDAAAGSRPLLPLVAGHLLDSLVFVPLMLGLLFFLFEFFGDQLLAFNVLVVVWLAEIWAVACLRTPPSLLLFPRVFTAAMVWVHAYYLQYPSGYVGVGLAAVALGLASVASFLWHTYELPALLDGSLSPGCPRSPAVAAVMATATAGSLNAALSNSVHAVLSDVASFAATSVHGAAEAAVTAAGTAAGPGEAARLTAAVEEALGGPREGRGARAWR